MYKYRNSLTGQIITTSAIITGGCWVLVEEEAKPKAKPKAKAKPKTEEE